MNGADYDKLYIERPNYSGPVDIFRHAAEIISDMVAACLWINIIEYGCGIGEFASLLYEELNGTSTKVDYTGYDFSEIAIDRAKLKNLGSFNFIEADILNLIHFSAGIFCSFQMLEHLPAPDGDFRVIERIPEGSLFLFSVPLNSFGKYHKIIFRNENQIRERYSKILTIKNHKQFGERLFVESIRESKN